MATNAETNLVLFRRRDSKLGYLTKQQALDFLEQGQINQEDIVASIKRNGSHEAKIEFNEHAGEYRKGKFSPNDTQLRNLQDVIDHISVTTNQFGIEHLTLQEAAAFLKTRGIEVTAFDTCQKFLPNQRENGNH